VADKQSTTYIPGGGPEAVSANKAYEDALQQMLASLDARKNKLFEPTLLAIAAGSAKPTQTGGWGESLGNVAKSLQESEAQQMTEAQKYAEAKLGLAGRGLELERQRSRERQFQGLMGAPIQKSPGALPGAVKVAPGALPDSTVLPGRGNVQVEIVGGVPSMADMLDRSPVEKTIEAPQPVAVEAPPGFAGVQGIQIAPPSSNYMDRQKYIALASMDPNISPAEAVKNANEMDAKRYQTKESGVLDLATGMFYAFPKGDQVDRQIFGDGGGKTYKVDARTATLLDLYASTNNPKYFEVADRVLKGPQRKGEGDGAPTQVLSTEDKAAQQKAQEAYQTKRAESAAAKEDDLQKRSNIASRMYSSASDVQYRLSESPSFFGLFSRPGLMSSIGNLVNQAVQAGNTTVKLGGFEQSITQLMPGLKQADLDNVMAAAGSLAEIELLYTQELMNKQGQITEGERAIVRRIPGTTSSSPAVLKDKMDLLKMHAQRDIDLADAYKQFKQDNKGKGVNYNDFEESKEYENMKMDYEKALAKRFKLEEAIPTRKRDGTASGAPKTRDNTGARTRLDY
tara:strand:+ start:162 stop:1865 length:1704 start_codon:yes stop_codon:yes gene_type:complete